MVGFAVASVIHLGGRGWLPVGDDAVVVARARDVLSTTPPILGMPTSLIMDTGEWTYHPGPLLYAWLAPFVLTMGRVSGGATGATALNVAAIVASWWFARSIVGRVGGLVAGTAALLVATSFAPIYQPLNSALSACSTFAVLVTAWAVLVRIPGATYALVAFASIAAQAHVAYAVVVLAVAVPIVVWDLVIRWQTIEGDLRRHVARAVAPVAGFAVVLWLGPIADGGRNFVRLLLTSDASYPARGVGQGFTTVVTALGQVPITTNTSGALDWSPTAKEVDPLFAGELTASTVVVATIGAILLATTWRRSREVRTGSVVLALAALATFVGTARLPLREPLDVQLYWARCVSLFAFGLYLLAVWVLVRDHLTRPTVAPAWAVRASAPVVALASLVALVVVVAVASRSVDDDWLAGTPERTLAEATARAASDTEVVDTDEDLALVALGGVRTLASASAEQAMFAMAAERLEHGNPVFLDADWYWGADRSLDRRPGVLPTILVTTQPVPGSLPESWREIAHVDPPTPTEPGAADRIADAVLATGEPIQLTEEASWAAPIVVDGFLPGSCEDPDVWLDDPTRFATDAPQALVELYRAGLVASPAVPPEVNEDLWRDPLYGLWVYRVDGDVPQDLAFAERFVLNATGCDR